MRATKIILLTIVAMFGIFTVLGFTAYKEPEAKPEAQYNSFKNSFIVGCEEEVKKTYTEAEAKSMCACGWTEINELYPDFTTNTERLNRILEQGYTQEEMRAVNKCYQEYESA